MYTYFQMAKKDSLKNLNNRIFDFIKINPYFFSFIPVLLALGFHLLFGNILHSYSIYISLSIAVLAASWHGGFWPGIIATFESIVIIGFILIDPSTQSMSQIILTGNTMIIYFVEGLLISMLSQAKINSEKAKQEVLINEKIARRNAEQQTRIMEHFFSVASHELKSPITSQKAYLQLLKKSVKNNNHTAYIEYLDKIESKINILIEFINDLLDVSKMKSKKLNYNFTQCVINTCIQEGIENISDLLIQHKIVIKGDQKIKVFCDKNRIVQVITNLLSNAIKYSPNADKIIIEIKKPNGYAQVSVRDFGIGIKVDLKEKIFNRFFRVTGKDESRFRGLGLGLYITEQIIRKHKGKIWVESAEGQGSIFYFTLPISQNSSKIRNKSKENISV